MTAISALLAAARTAHEASALTIFEQALHKLHKPPPGQRHVEVPARFETAKDALLAADLAGVEWRAAVNSTSTTVFDAVDLLKRVHSIEHLREVQAMSKTGGGFDSDTYCAPGSWEAVLDGTRAWVDALKAAADGRGPAYALARPAGHHATRDTAMGFGLVNYAAAATAAALDAVDSVAVLDWDVHYGNGVAAIFADEPRVRYCSIHEAGGFPGSAAQDDPKNVGPLGNLRHLPLPKGSGSEAFFEAMDAALEFLLEPAPGCLLICSGYDALAPDPLATMSLSPEDFGRATELVLARFPRERVALGLEGGYDLGPEGMPAAFVETCRQLC